MGKKFLFTTVSALLLGWVCLAGLDAQGQTDKKPVDETLYLPNGRGLKLLSLGFENVFADILWFNTISYFGKHFRSDQKYQWLSHMCNLVVDLDPRAAHVYHFGALMLSWEIGAIAESNALLTKAITAFPDNWMFYYLRGFNHLFFLKNPAAAKEDLLISASKPNAHPLIAQLAAKKVAELEDPKIAEDTLRRLIQTTADPMIRSVFEKRLKELRGRPQ